MNSLWLVRRMKYMDVFHNPVTFVQKTDLAAKHAKCAKGSLICSRVRRAHRLPGVNMLLQSEYGDDEGEDLCVFDRAGELIFARISCWLSMLTVLYIFPLFPNISVI